MPALVMVRYNVPDELSDDIVPVADLPESWRLAESLTQERGDRWHTAKGSPLLRVPSTIIPLDGSPDQNVLINHGHPDAAKIRTLAVEPFELDVRLFERP